jgi:hypothetical protein
VERGRTCDAVSGRSIAIPRSWTRPVAKIRHLETRTKCSSRSISQSPPSNTQRTRRSRVVPSALPETVFSIGTVAVLPLYGAMIAAPNSAITKRAMRSCVPFAVMGSLYFVAMAATVQSVEIQALVKTFITGVLTSGDFIGKWLTFVSACFGTATTAASGWLHLLSLDLFVARHVYLDGLETNVPSAHSLILCCMFGPCGFLAHVLTKTVWDKVRR